MEESKALLLALLVALGLIVSVTGYRLVTIASDERAIISEVRDSNWIMVCDMFRHEQMSSAYCQE